MQQTLVLLKPDAVKRGLVGEVISRFEKSGLKLVAVRMLRPDKQHYHHHYEGISQLKSRIGEEPFNQNTEFMMSGPVVAIVLEGNDAVAKVRQLVGATDPGQAKKGTIRGDYGEMTLAQANELNIALANVVHASGNTEEAKAEIDHWFKAEELHDYKTARQELTQ